MAMDPGSTVPAVDAAEHIDLFLRGKTGTHGIVPVTDDRLLLFVLLPGWHPAFRHRRGSSFLHRGKAGLPPWRFVFDKTYMKYCYPECFVSE